MENSVERFSIGDLVQLKDIIGPSGQGIIRSKFNDYSVDYELEILEIFDGSRTNIRLLVKHEQVRRV